MFLGRGFQVLQAMVEMNTHITFFWSRLSRELCPGRKYGLQEWKTITDARIPPPPNKTNEKKIKEKKERKRDCQY